MNKLNEQAEKGKLTRFKSWSIIIIPHIPIERGIIVFHAFFL